MKVFVGMSGGVDPAPKRSLVRGRQFRVFCAMSGGVDSSVAAALLKQQGYEVVGAHMKCFNVDGCAAQDAEDARRAAETIGIPFYTFNFEREYKNLVVKYMIDGYRKGTTPNPDVMCNKEIKFGLFYQKAMELGADYIATGHYVRLKPSTNNESKTNERIKTQFVNSKHIRYSLISAKDKNKDQSYFLWTLKSGQLKHCLFPVGDYTKPQVRKLAVKFGLHNAQKKDSQGICFLGQISLPNFLKKYIKPKAGNVLNADGKIIGRHNGAHFYTIGQRHGIMNNELRIKNKPNQKPFYVSEKDVKKNLVVVAEGENNPALYKKEIELTHINLFNPIIPACRQAGHNSKSIVSVFARVRYRQPLAKAKFYIPNSRELGDKRTAILVFDKPIKFVAPGQSAVFYRARRSLGEGGYEMLGGGIIRQ